jgi:hypothetical protein
MPPFGNTATDTAVATRLASTLIALAPPGNSRNDGVTMRQGRIHVSCHAVAERECSVRDRIDRGSARRPQTRAHCKT